MRRAAEIRQLTRRLHQLNPTMREIATAFGLLCEGKSHEELAQKRGIKTASNWQAHYRFRKRARAHGIVVPSAFRRCGERQTLAQANRRKAG